MTEGRYEIVLYRSERQYLSLEALASRAGLHPEIVECFVEYELIEPVEWMGAQSLFDDSAILRLQTVKRLRSDIGVNLAGVAVILDLIDRLRTLQQEIERLRGRL